MLPFWEWISNVIPYFITHMKLHSTEKHECNYISILKSQLIEFDKTAVIATFWPLRFHGILPVLILKCWEVHHVTSWRGNPSLITDPLCGEFIDLITKSKWFGTLLLNKQSNFRWFERPSARVTSQLWIRKISLLTRTSLLRPGVVISASANSIISWENRWSPVRR